MKFLLFDREENYIRNLENVTLAKHSEEINGEDVFELEIAGNTDIKKGYKIVYKSKYGYWNEFIVREIEEDRTDTLVTRLFCESSFYETLGDFIEDKRPDHSTATGALMVALEPTRWEVGIIDDLGINSTNFYNISSKEAVQKVAETWKGEIRTRIIISGNKITHRYVDLLKQRGNDLGKRFTYTKDLEAVTKTIHRDDVITALYGYGKGEEVGDGYGRRINFADINNGKAYVENNEARLIWGRNNPDGSKSHIFGKVEFDDCEDREELKILTEEKLEELSRSLITYEANVIDLKAYGFEHEGVELGDTVGVIDKEFTPDLRLKARVVRVERDLLEDENTITLGNFMPNILDSLNEYEDYINNFRGKQGVWDRSQIISDDGSINAQFLNNLVNELNTRMNSTGGYVYVSDDGQGLTTYDKPIDQNPTMAIQLLGGAFRIANSKLPTGEFNWRTFGDGNGFVADSFVGGLLKGGKVNFDLTNGTLLIGNSTEDYSMYFDGLNLLLGSDVEFSWANINNPPSIPNDDYITNITKDTVTTTYLKSLNLEVGNEIIMGANARISWTNVDDKPTIPSVPSYIKSTYIDSVSIESPNITGGTITGGSITSNSTINVTTDAYIGDNLYLGDSLGRNSKMIRFNSGASISSGSGAGFATIHVSAESFSLDGNSFFGSTALSSYTYIRGTLNVEDANVVGLSSSDLPINSIVSSSGGGTFGRWIRFGNGIQICWYNTSLTYTSGTTIDRNWTYPMPFSAPPAVSGNATESTSVVHRSLAVYFTSVTNSGCTALMSRPTGSTDFTSSDSRSVSFMAIGAW